MNTINEKKEIRSLTGLRGVAALLVVVHHFFGPPLLGLNAGNSIPDALKIFIFHGYLAVDIFFILSAFVITLSSHNYFSGPLKFSNYKNFMRKRWVRVYPSYFFTILFALLFIYHFKRIPNFIVSLFLLNLVFGLPSFLTHLWSLSAEWITYLLYPLFYKAFNINSKKYWKFILTGFGLGILIAVACYSNHSVFSEYSLDSFTALPALSRCFADYLLGMGAYYIVHERAPVFSFLYGNLFSSILVSFVIISMFFARADVFLIFLFMLLIISLAPDNNGAAKLLSSPVVYFLGVISYPLYLIHFIFIMDVRPFGIFAHTQLPPNVPEYVMLVAYIVLSVTIAALWTYFVEKPLISFLNIFFSRRKAKPGLNKA